MEKGIPSRDLIANCQEISNTEVIDYINNLDKEQLKLVKHYVNKLLKDIDLLVSLKEKADRFNDVRRFHSVNGAFNSPRYEEFKKDQEHQEAFNIDK